MNDDPPREITPEMISRRAFELWLTNGSATPEENWARAEEELREESGLGTEDGA